MKWIKSLVIVLVAMAVLGLTSSVMAAEAGMAKAEKAVKQTTIKGVVNVKKDSKGKVTAVELTAEDSTVYKVKMNMEGKALEKEAGKQVEAVGVVTEKGGVQVLKVKSWKLVEDIPQSGQ